jgi:hypothetical protein
MGSIAYAVSRPVRRRLLPAAIVLIIVGAVLVVVLGPPGHRSVTGRSGGGASLSTFTRYWWGHGRGLSIYRSGRARESVRTYINKPPFNAVVILKIISVNGSAVDAEAHFRVLAIRDPYHSLRLPSRPPIRVGQIGTLRFLHGIVTDSLTGDNYCGPTVGRCGT